MTTSKHHTLISRLFIAVVMAALTGTAWAADISNLSGQSCGALAGEWHFVNNQTRGMPVGTLTAMWDSGDMCVVSAGKVNNANQHFYCSASGELVSASTNIGGRLVLSDFSCDECPKEGCEPPPPPPCEKDCEPPK